MVDRTRVARLLRGVTDAVSLLEAESSAEAERRDDPMWLAGVKYTFITGIEGCVDVAQHICSAQGWGPPTDNGDAIALLGRHDVLSADTAAALRKAVGFRNVLVHEYVTVSEEIVLSRLADLRDLRSFVGQVSDAVARGRD